MVIASFRLLALLPLLLPAAQAANDWKVPCFNGVCEYDLNGETSGNMRIWGAADAITDITSAANWEILDCDSGKLDQDIRLVCKDDEDNSGCSHLYDRIGAVGKIVRLPESCGKSAFARISKAWVHEDQSIPASLAKHIVRRDGTAPLVKGLHIDTNFHLGSSAKTGPVNIALTAFNLPGFVPIDASKGSKVITRRRLGKAARRGLGDIFGKIKDGVKEGIEKVKDKVGDVIDAGKETIEKAGEKIEEAAEKVGEKVEEAGGKVLEVIVKGVEADKTIELPPISLNKNGNLVNAAITCGALDAGVNIDINSKGEARVTVGVVAHGTLLPLPAFTDFQLLSGLNADIDGELLITADVSGSLDSGRIPIFELGIPGLDIPGIVAIGPTFTINAQAKAELLINLDMTVGFKYKIDDAKLFFPPRDSKSGGAFTIQDTRMSSILYALKLDSGNANIDGSGTIEAHLIPGINFGVSVFKGFARAEVFLEADAKAVLKLDFAKRTEVAEAEDAKEDEVVKEDDEDPQADNDIEEEDEEVAAEDEEAAGEDETVIEEDNGGAEADDEVVGDAESAGDEVLADGSEPGDNIETVTASARRAKVTPTSIIAAPKATKVVAAKRPERNVTAGGVGQIKARATQNPDGSVTTKGICVDLKAGLDVKAGARGSLFKIFDEQTAVSLFKKEFQLFKKCFGDDVSTPATGLVEENNTRRSISVVGTRRDMRRLASRQQKISKGKTPGLASGLSCLKQLLPVNPLSSGSILASQINAF